MLFNYLYLSILSLWILTLLLPLLFRCDLSGKTGLHLACSTGQLPVVKYLIEEGSDYNLQDKNGWTSIHFAAYNGHIEVLTYLLQNCPDIQGNNHSNINLYDLSTEHIIRLLESNMQLLHMIL